MKIAILGNGKMGRRISKLATKKGHEIVMTSCSKNTAISLDLSVADVAIDFSTPTTAFENISHAINYGIPVISGTTGWLNQLKIIEDLCKAKNGAFLYASNFSLGMNLFFKLNKQLSGSTFQKLKDAFIVYNKYLKFNFLKSLVFTIILSSNFLIKRYL